MASFENIFPTFLQKCAELNELLRIVAFALFIVGTIMLVTHGFTGKTLMLHMVRLFVLTALLVFLPQWGNQVQSLLQSSILNGLGVDPSNVQDQYNQLLVIRRDTGSTHSWWDIIGNVSGFTVEVLISGILWLIGQFASLMLFWAYIIQKFILFSGYALAPLLIGFMAIRPLRHTGSRYLMHLVGVLLWPLGWAVAALITQGILDFMTDQSLRYLDPTATFYTLQESIGVLVLAFWIIFSTIAAPVIIQRAIATGSSVGSDLFSGAFAAGHAAGTAGVMSLAGMAGNTSLGGGKGISAAAVKSAVIGGAAAGAVATAVAAETLVTASINEGRGASSVIGSLSRMNDINKERTRGSSGGGSMRRQGGGGFPPDDPAGDKTVGDMIRKSKNPDS